MKQRPANWPAFLLDHFPYEKNQTNNICLITGDSGVGKTTWCQRWLNLARAAGWQVAGLLSPPVLELGEKVGIELVDLASGERRPLAQRRPTEVEANNLITKQWWFDTAVLDWGNHVLQQISTVDLLIIDELGPLEFERGQGLQAAFDLLTAGNYRLAGVVVRPSLISHAQQRWPEAQAILPQRN